MTSRDEDERDDFSTVAQPRYDPTPVADLSFALVVTAGPDVGRRFVVDDTGATRVFIGQSATCELRLTDREVSRRHAALEWTNARLHLTDLSSRNGTRVNGVDVVEAIVKAGDQLAVGATVLRVDPAAKQPAPPLPPLTGFGRLLGASREMRRLYPICERLAAANVTVLIEGETGTGKEVLAEALHEMGPRAQAPFVVFDCTAVPPTLVESEIFGHERGAFTGATATRMGVFEQANGGTLLIDEIGDLELHLQPKLLRALERGEVRRVGGDRWIKVDVRVLSATRRDLDREVQLGRFRDDLYHRLAVARIELPPLRRRQGDVSLLTAHFCRMAGKSEREIGPDILAKWEELPWRGNVRELRNAVARQLALGDLSPADEPARHGDSVEKASVERLDALVEKILAEGTSIVAARRLVVDAFERRYIQHVLDQNGGNVVRAAAASGIARRYFQILRARGQK